MSIAISFDDAIKNAGGEDGCSLLLGNGFSAKYFSYRSLLEKADLKVDDPVRRLFDQLKTVDFERVVKALEGASEVETAYGNNEHAKQLTADAQRVREALVHAIRGTHPAHREDIGGVIPSAGSFFVFGHSADPNDAHIYHALFGSKIKHLYFCIYQPDDDKIKTVSGELARYKERAGSKIDYTFVDSESAHVWDLEPPTSSTT